MARPLLLSLAWFAAACWPVAGLRAGGFNPLLASSAQTPAPPAAVAFTRPSHRFDPRAARGGAEINSFRQVHTDAGIDPSWLVPPTEPYRVGPGDQLEIELLEFPETRQACPVLPDGTVFFHILDGLKVSGLTLDEIKAAMENGLAVNYRNPRVSIIVRAATNRKVWIMGRCKKPGVYTLDGPTTVLEAISLAGGFDVARSLGDSEEIVDLPHAFLVREGRFVPINFTKLVREGDTSQNIYLKNNDSIFLPSAAGARAYVMGAVMDPRVVDFRDQLTLSAAIANAGGLTPHSYPQHVVIIRDSLTNPRAAVVNFNEIMHGKVTDVVLQAKDIVWVPNSPFTRLDDFYHLIVNTFVRTVAANEGLRAGAPGQQSLGVNIGINSP